MHRSLLRLSFLSLAACVGNLTPGATKAPGERPPDDPVKPPIEVAIAPAQVRVLSAPEYRGTIRDLLGLTVSPTLTHADWTGGFDNGAAIQVDENLFSALLTEGEALAQQYVATRLATDFPCFDPAAISDACVRTVISQLGRRAYRRPLTAAQADELFTFFEGVADRPLGVELLITRLITSPHLLYRTEVGHRVQAGSDRFALDDFEKASLIAYTLTGTMPDEALLADAEAGLLDDAHLRAHVRRLWAAPRTRERQAGFFRQWLKVTTLDQMARQPGDFVKLTAPEQGPALKAEFDAYVGAVIFDGTGTLPALFSESFTFVDRHTAPLYGLTSTQDVAQRVALDPAQRRGILTLASTMAAIGSASDSGKDRPVLRGLMIKKQLLCEDVGPPSNVNTVVARDTAMMTPDFDQLTTRAQYEAMMQQGAECRACHRQFMPLGFAFGRYDALGRYRTTQHGKPVDAAVSDVPIGGEVKAFSGAQDLVDTIAKSPTTTACFSRNFVKYVLGAAAAPHTETLSDSLVQQLGTEPLELARLVEETLASPHLYVRLGVPEAPVISAPDAGVTPDAGVAADAGVDAGVPVVSSRLLDSGESLAAGASKLSPGGGFTLLNQLDGNLVLYRTGGAPVWASNTSGAPGVTSMQGDGNFVVYDRDGQPRFHTGTHGNPGAVLHVDTTGRLLILAANGRELWSSGVP